MTIRRQTRQVPQVRQADVAWLVLDAVAAARKDPAKAVKLLLAARPELLAMARTMIVEQDLGEIARTGGDGRVDWDVAA